MLRISSYSILSEPLPGGGYGLVNGCTGAIDLLSNELAGILSQLLSKNPRDSVYIPEGVIDSGTLNQFLERGHITKLPHEAERNHIARIANLIHEFEQTNPHFILIPSLDCNYRCVYCFERPFQKEIDSTKGSQGGIDKTFTLTQDQAEAFYMSVEQIRSDLEKRAISKDLKEIGFETEQDNKGQVILYGGEPLNADNKDIVSFIVQRGIDLGYHFAATTNGHDIDHFLPIIGEGKIEQLQITFDGPKAVHDKRRISRRGDSSFDKIMSNIRLVLAMKDPPEVQIRVHVYPSTIDMFDEILETFGNEGWLNHKDVIIYISNIFVKDRLGKVSANIHYGDIMAQWHNVVSPYSNVFIGGVSVHTQRLLLPMLELGKPCRLRSTYCGANSGSYIFSPDGCIYTCWESVGKECSRIGRYTPGKGAIFDIEKRDTWFNRSVARMSDCLDCPYCLFCGGGCSQYAEYNAGSLYKPFCDDFQELYPEALAFTVEKYLSTLGKQSDLDSKEVLP